MADNINETELAEAQDIQLDAGVSEDDAIEGEDSLTFSNGVIEKIVALAVREVPGVLGMKGGWANMVQEAFGAKSPTKGVTVEVAPDNGVRVNISILIEYGTYAPQVFEDVKKAVVESVSGMTGLDISSVNLRIEDILTPEEIEAQRAREHRDEEAEDASEGEE